MTDHPDRSFPDAADGRPMPPMGDELMAAGLSDEDARFVARMLQRGGYHLVRAEDIGWPEIAAFQAELKRGQGVTEDGGGFWARAIMTLCGRKPDPVETYRKAVEALLAASTPPSSSA